MRKEQLQQDLKAALLGGDKAKAEVLRGLKSAILYEEISKNKRAEGLSDDEILAVLGRESKKRAESIELYKQAGAAERAEKERLEKAIIDAYLPAQLSDAELEAIVETAQAELGSGAGLGQVIAAVRYKVGARADGARIAAIVKGKLQ